ncbi:unnamed protein product [Oreochromis niloticus]|nr:unnamed protein product [Mustela putorius furo]
MGLQGKVTPLQARRHEITLKNTKIASIQAQERGSVGDQNDSDDEAAQPPTTGRKRKRDRDDELLDLIREDMRQQREAEERRAGRGRTDCFHF